LLKPRRVAAPPAGNPNNGPHHLPESRYFL
jgi:hypothetical protein